MSVEAGTASGADVRAAMSRIVSGVAVATTKDVDGPAGMTISSFISITLDPPTVLICLNTSNRGYAAVRRAGCYAVNVLAGSHRWIAALFATPGLANDERFRRVEHRTVATGSPILAGAAAWMDCAVTEVNHIGTHGLFFGRVIAAGQDELDEVPLAYYQREMYPLRPPDL